ncbi:MAG TPA: hypothetical protein VM779_15555 [Thermoanaerobaculia bacterium]|nr:hypothetical protein [Thermoanaerobaculia bacterium]
MVAVLCLLLLSFPLSAQKAFVVDMEGKAIAAVDLGSGKVTSSVTLPFTPDRALVLPDGKSVLALYQGEGTYGFWAGEFRPKGPSQAAFIRDGKLAGSTELGWGLAQASFSADGKSAYVLTTGYESNKEAERKPSELLRIDTATGKIAGRLAFDAAAEAFAADASGTTGIVYSPAYPKKKPAPLQARITFIDLKSFEAGPVVELTGEIRRPVASGEKLYVLDAGNRKNPGNLHIIDTRSRALAKTIPLGPEAVMAGTDSEGRVIVLAQAADRKSGRLWLIKGTEVAGEWSGPAAPKFVSTSADGKRLYIAGWKDFGMVDLASNQAGASVELARDPFAVLPTRDNSRVFVVSMDNTSCCRITAFDVTNMKRLTSFLGGSKGARFGQALAAVAFSAASYQSGKSAAQASGADSFTYSVYTPTTYGAARGPLAFSPDEKKVYLADTQTNDVTVVDVASGQRLKNISAGRGLREVILLPKAGVIAAIADQDLRTIDVNTDEVRDTIKLDDNVTDALITADGKRVVIFGKGHLIVIDAETGKEVARSSAFKQPVAVLFGK